MNRIATKILSCACIVVFMCSCATSKKILYFQDIEKKKDLVAFHNYEPTIKKDDQLKIIVSGPVKEVILPYNLTIGDVVSEMPYHVNASGSIDFPTLGKLHVEGMTISQLSELLTTEISKDVRDPVVNISFENFRVTILGEVRSPGTITLPSEKTTLLQALGMVGDLSISAKRTNVLLLREIDGKYEYAKLDLRKTDLISSPYYYLRQNDVIYVSPNQTAISSATTPLGMISIFSSTLSVGLSVFALIKLFG